MTGPVLRRPDGELLPGYVAALALLLPVARVAGLPRILLTCDEHNEASARVIARNGGVPAGTEGEGGGRKRLFWVPTTG